MCQDYLEDYLFRITYLMIPMPFTQCTSEPLQYSSVAGNQEWSPKLSSDRPTLSTSSVGKESFYKTKLCVFHALQGHCIHGADCTYAHGVHDLVSADGLLHSPPPIQGSKICGSSAFPEDRPSPTSLIEGASLPAARRQGNRGMFPKSEKTGNYLGERRGSRRSRAKAGRRWTVPDPSQSGGLPVEDLLIGSRMYYTSGEIVNPSQQHHHEHSLYNVHHTYNTSSSIGTGTVSCDEARAEMTDRDFEEDIQVTPEAIIEALNLMNTNGIL